MAGARECPDCAARLQYRTRTAPPRGRCPKCKAAFALPPLSGDAPELSARHASSLPAEPRRVAVKRGTKADFALDEPAKVEPEPEGLREPPGRHSLCLRHRLVITREGASATDCSRRLKDAGPQKPTTDMTRATARRSCPTTPSHRMSQ
jgi:hypothetical protein